MLTTRTSAQSNDIGIWKDGCIEILEVMLKRDLIEYPFAWVYIGVGLILALVELITVFLACSYVAQINRSGQKNLAWFLSMIICSPFTFFCKMLQTAKTSEDVHQGRWWRQQIPSRWERFKRWSGDLKAKHWRENCQSPKGTRLLPHLVNIFLPSQVTPLDQVVNMTNKWSHQMVPNPKYSYFEDIPISLKMVCLSFICISIISKKSLQEYLVSLY